MVDGGPWSTKTARRLTERVAPPQGGVVSPILSNLLRSISGWRGRTRTFRGVGMRMMDWFTAGTSKKPRPSRPNFKPAWQSAAWSCPTKTRIVYCKDRNRKGAYPNVHFDFLGYRFRSRVVRRSRDNKLFCGFNRAVSSSALKAMRTTIREMDFRHQTQLSRWIE
jgi:hypothetical protein